MLYKSTEEHVKILFNHSVKSDSSVTFKSRQVIFFAGLHCFRLTKLGHMVVVVAQILRSHPRVLWT